MSWFKRNSPAPPPHPPEIQRQVDDRVNELRGQYTPGRRPIGEWVERQYAVIDQIRAFAFAEGFEEGVAGAHADNWERRAFCGHAQAFRRDEWMQLYCGRHPGHDGVHCGLTPEGDRWQWPAGQPETYRPLVDFRAEDFIKVTPPPPHDVAGVAEMNDLARKALADFNFETPRGGIVINQSFTPTGQSAPLKWVSPEEKQTDPAPGWDLRCPEIHPGWEKRCRRTVGHAGGHEIVLADGEEIAWGPDTTPMMAPSASIEERVQALEARLEKLGSLLKLDNA